VRILRSLPSVSAIVVNAEIDIIVGYRGRNYVFELKSPTSVTHRARGSVREKQAALRARWTGQYDVVELGEEGDDIEWIKPILEIIGWRDNEQRRESISACS